MAISLPSPVGPLLSLCLLPFSFSFPWMPALRVPSFSPPSDLLPPASSFLLHPPINSALKTPQGRRTSQLGPQLESHTQTRGRGAYLKESKVLAAQISVPSMSRELSLLPFWKRRRVKRGGIICLSRTQNKWAEGLLKAQSQRGWQRAHPHAPYPILLDWSPWAAWRLDPHRHQAGDDGGGERGAVNGGQGGPDVREKHPECDLILWLHPLNEGGPIRKRSLKP